MPVVHTPYSPREFARLLFHVGFNVICPTAVSPVSSTMRRVATLIERTFAQANKLTSNTV
jgi:hypothetical protein